MGCLDKIASFPNCPDVFLCRMKGLDGCPALDLLLRILVELYWLRGYVSTKCIMTKILINKPTCLCDVPFDNEFRSWDKWRVDLIMFPKKSLPAKQIIVMRGIDQNAFPYVRFLRAKRHWQATFHIMHYSKVSPSLHRLWGPSSQELCYM